MYPDPSQHLSYQAAGRLYFYSHGYDPLHNWSAHQIKIWRKKFGTVENAYQFKKLELMSPEVAIDAAKAPSPWEAVRISKSHDAYRREDWDKVKVSVMTELLRAKMDQHKDVRLLLLKTMDMELVLNSPSNSFWGIGADGQGKNMLGKIWMKLREELYQDDDLEDNLWEQTPIKLIEPKKPVEVEEIEVEDDKDEDFIEVKISH